MSVRVNVRKAGWAVAWLAALLPAATAVAQTEDEILDWTLKVEPAQGGAAGEVDLVLSARILKGWILYSSDFEPADFGPRPAKIKVIGAVGPLQAIGASSKNDKTPAGTYTYFSNTAQFRQRVRLEGGAKSVVGTINGQTCFEENGLCALFRKQFDIPAETAAASEPADPGSATSGCSMARSSATRDGARLPRTPPRTANSTCRPCAPSPTTASPHC